MASSEGGQDQQNPMLGLVPERAIWGYLASCILQENGVHKHAKKDLGQYPVILTKQALSIAHYLIYSSDKCLLSLLDTSIITSPVIKHWFIPACSSDKS